MTTFQRLPQAEAELQQALDRAVALLGDTDRNDIYAVDEVVEASEDMLSWTEPGHWPWFGVYVRPDGQVESWCERGRWTLALTEDGTLTYWTTTEPADRLVVRGPIEAIKAKYRHPAAARFLN